MKRILMLLLLIGGVSACASSGASPRHDPDRITANEIATSGAQNALDLIQRLQPHWLRAQPTGSIAGGARNQIIVVYLDGHRLGDAGSLRTLSVSGIRSLEWLDAARAPTILTDIGSEPIAGAIVIKSM